MSRIRITILICVVGLVGRSVAQDKPAVSKVTRTVSVDAAEALAIEWNDPKGTSHCLKALDLYTLDPASGGNTVEALHELISGSPDAEKFYRLAQELGKMPELLATATTREIDKSDTKDVETLFADAKGSIADLYTNGPERLYRYVNQVSAYNRARALYNLLEWKKSDTNLMETYRTCYALNRDRLFDLVNAHFH